MQKWRPWEAASDAEWGLALEREAVIRPLAEQARLSAAAVNEARSRLHVSRSVFYDLVRRYRRRPQTSDIASVYGLTAASSNCRSKLGDPLPSRQLP